MAATRGKRGTTTVRKRRAVVTRRRATASPRTRRTEPKPAGRLRWVTKVSCEGGPLLAADLGDFLRWRGESEDAQSRIVKYYGKLVERLPPWLTPRGTSSWHQFLEVPTTADADRFVGQLRGAIAKLEPNFVERVQKALSESEILAKAREAMDTKGAGMKAWLAAWRQTVEQGTDFLVGAERVLHVHVDPASDYDRASEPLAEPSSGGACLASWSEGARGLLWDLESEGVAEVAIDRAAREVVLLRAWADSAAEIAALRRKAGTPDPQNAGVGEISIPSGILVIAWAPMWLGSLEGINGEPAAWLRAAASKTKPVLLQAEGFDDIGTVLSVAPGRYAIERGAHDAGTYSGRWCRLVYTGPVV